ncbi:ABC transporter ATP-binding protein [Dongia soli]|uniref:ABC transporter ATP-binding protein n=1 Tax=Dongia soli TaxID=600628 RepID=A0ABU5EDN3_9PROT|nr:ABC transporter ATP-binding protein [Dongia soli]MDY0884262.1 ABC transporter ATP-binding protein [Dongia soli]
MLELASVSTNYGAMAMLRDVSLAVQQNELVCLLGPNGAGKTTTFRAIAALLPLKAGRISLFGKDIAKLQTEFLAGLGIGFVPEGRRLFPELTVRENIRLGFDAARGRGDFEERLEAMATLFPRIKERIKQNAGTLSGGEQAMVALARALVAEPKLVVMDEPSLGLSPKLIDEYFDTVAEINRRGTSVLLIEQNAETALSIAHRGYLLIKGRIAASGSARELLDNDVVRKLYL